MRNLFRRISQSLRWRLGWTVAFPELEYGSDEDFLSYYSHRVTNCEFITDPSHYEYPRVHWICSRVSVDTCWKWVAVTEV